MNLEGQTLNQLIVRLATIAGQDYAGRQEIAGELILRLEADAQALADVRTLDEWAACEVACAERFEWTTSKMVPAHKGWRCVLRGITLQPVRDFTAPTPDAARAKSAEWVRKQAKGTKP